MTIVMGPKAQLKKTKKLNRKEEAEIVAMVREVQATTEKLRSLAEDKAKIEGNSCSFDLLPLPMFTGDYFDHWVIKMLTFFRAKELIVYDCNNPYDEVCNVLALNFIK